MSNSSSLSSLGRKYVMGVTGIFLVLFLIVHVGVNALIFVDSTGELFNAGAHFMGTNWIIRSMEFVLFAGIIVHIVQSLALTRQNRVARKEQYAISGSSVNSTWYSRSMGLLGTLIMIFLIIHLCHFWVEARFGIWGGIPQGAEPDSHDMYAQMKIIFSNLAIVIVYVLSMVSLSYHLMHGFQSAFQSLGLNHHKYTPAIKAIGKWYSIIVPVLFALMPLYVYFVINK